MTKVNAMEMRSVEGGAYYATCSRCGCSKKIKWNWQFLLGSWWMNNVYVPDASGVMTERCWQKYGNH